MGKLDKIVAGYDECAAEKSRIHVQGKTRKRLLRYALSKLELLNTNQLDLEKLDIALGKNSTVSLKDVEINTEKLTALLHLPERIQFLHARVLQLRVTIPADIYTTGINIQIDGVDACAKLLQEQHEDAGTHKEKSSEGQESKIRSPSKSNKAKSKGSNDFTAGGEHIPTAEDLAKSFLQDEGVGGGKDLRDALRSQSQLPQESVILDDNEDVALDTGTGTALSMPRFLTNFLHGISNRLQIAIENVQFTLRATVELNRGNNTEKRGVPLSIIMGIQKIALNASSGSQGARTVHLDGISGSLACDTDALASLSRISSPSSPVFMGSPEASVSRANLQKEQRGHGRAQPKFTKTPEVTQRSASSLEKSVPSAENDPLLALSGSQCVDPSHLDDSILTNDSDRFADADKYGYTHNNYDHLQSGYRPAEKNKITSLEDNDAKSASNLNENAVLRHEQADTFAPIAQDASAGVLSPKSTTPAQNAQTSDKFRSIHNIEHAAEEAPQPVSFASNRGYQTSPNQSQSRSSVPSRTNENFSSSESSADNEDLARSTLFTHEEAASMYYSVTSNVLSKDKRETSATREIKECTQEEKLKKAEKISQSPFKESGLASDNNSVQALRTRTVAYHDEKFIDDDKDYHQPTGHCTTKLFMSVDIAIISFLGSPDASTVDEGYFDGPRQQSEMNTRHPQPEYDIPGAFSQYAEAGARRQRQGSTAQSTRFKQVFDTKQEYEPIGDSGDRPNTLCRARRVNLGSVSVDIDVLRGCLLYEVLNQIISSTQSGVIADNTGDPHSPSETTTPIEINVENIVIRILSDANSHTLDAYNESEGKSDKSDYYASNLLKLSMTKINMLSQFISGAHQIDLGVLGLRFGFEMEEILSFDAKARMRTSTRDLKEPQSKVMTCSILTSEKQTVIQISMLPALLSLDIHKIDDFLEACGGVGSIIELSSSINSNSTSQRVSQADRKHTKSNTSDDRQSDRSGFTAQVKCNARIAGSLITLKARSCLINARTSAIKLVHRTDNTAVQIDEVEIKNPQIGKAFENGSPLLQMRNNRIQFLSVPEEDDLGQLVTLVAPSVGGYEDNEDVLLDTLLAQRKKGTSLRTTTSIVKLNMPRLSDLKLYQSLSDELAKLTAVKKYLPAESRPGMLLLVSVDQVDVILENLDNIGAISLQCQKISVAYIAVPMLLALSVGDVIAKYQTSIELVHRVSNSSVLSNVPMVLACFIGDDLESTLKFKLNKLCCEYSVPTVMALAMLVEEISREESIPNKGISVAPVTEKSSQRSSSKSSPRESTSFFRNQSFRLKIFLHDCALGLNPRMFQSKGLLVFTSARLSMIPEGKNINFNVDVRKASLLVIDEASRIIDEVSETWMHKDKAGNGDQHLEYLCALGYVSVSTISSANASIKIVDHGELAAVRRSVDVDLKNELFIVETCADSTQTALDILNGLRVPTKPNKDAQFRTEVMPMQDIMASFSGDAVTELDNGNSQELIDPLVESMLDDGGRSEDLELTKSLYNLETIPFSENLDQNLLDDDLESIDSLDTAQQSQQRVKRRISIGSKNEETKKVDLEFEENYFSAQYHGSKSRQKGVTSEDDSANEIKVEHLRSPFTLKVRDVHIIWNLFDGYDWPATRETIATAVNDLEIKAEARRREREKYKEPEEDQPVIGDYLFNSIWIDIPPNKNPHDLSAQVSRDVNDRASETGSYSTSAVSRSPNRVPRTNSRSKRLKLARGRHHKITFELRGVSADVVVFPPDIGETQSSIDLSVTDFEIFDHVLSSTWKKFATYMHDAGEREMGRPMIRFEISNVKPVPELAASELVLRVSILPLRLHVDQDALDFIIRFFEFKSKGDYETAQQEEKVFLQRVEINKIMLKLDYKPKKVDYTGLHSGHTTELMNFFILDGSDIILRHAILYGISGFDNLHKTLNDIWMPDVKRNQLPGVLAGLAPVRSLVNVGGGVRDLVVIPMREYRKDGRIVRSIRKGALAFARTTTSEIARFGAKLAIGTQNVLQGTEDILANPAERKSSGRDWDTEADEYNEPTSDALKSPVPPPTTTSLSSSPSSGPNPVRAVSNYADQPIGVLAGMRGAARSLERDLLTARDAVIAIQGEVMESNSAGAAAKAVARRAPTVILRPAIGASKAVGMTLLGAGNALDKDSRRRIEDKYKRI